MFDRSSALMNKIYTIITHKYTQSLDANTTEQTTSNYQYGITINYNPVQV